MIRRFFYSFLWSSLLFIFPVRLDALTPLPLNWHMLLSSRSGVILDGETKAEFKIRGSSSSNREGLNVGGYGYLTSGPIHLPANWQNIYLYGQWWQPKSHHDDCEKMNLSVSAGKPGLLDEQAAEADSNYIEIGYDNWQGAIMFVDNGTGDEDYEQVEIPRDVPSRPTPFRIEIKRNKETGLAEWAFFEKREGAWEQIFSTGKAAFLQGKDATELFWKIGGTANNEGTSFCQIKFRGLGYEVTQSPENGSGLQDGPGQDGNEGEESHELQEADTKFLCDQGEKAGEAEPALSCNKSAASLDYKSLIPYADGETIPISGGCRGACGGGCPDQCQAMSDRAIQISGADGSCYYLVYYKQVKRCGSHVGCRYHDSCFDYCKEVKKELGTLKELKPCHDYCSGIVVQVFGARMGGSWMTGNGPYDENLIFFDSTKDNPRVMGPFDSNSMPIEALKSMGIIDRDTEVVKSADLPSKPQKALYAIEVWTGTAAEAGTDSPIAITLFDSHGHSSGEMVLPPSPFPVVPKTLSDVSFPRPDDWSSLLDAAGGYAFKPYKFLDGGVINWGEWGYKGFERGSHETYYFLLGNYLEDVSQIRLRRLNKDPEYWNLMEKIEGRVRDITSTLEGKGKKLSHEVEGTLRKTGKVVMGDAYLQKALKAGTKIKKAGSNAAHETSEFIKDSMGTPFVKRNNTDWYCKRIRVFQERWNSFAVSRLLGDFGVESWITKKGKDFANGILPGAVDNLFIYTYDNYGKRLLAIDPETGKAHVVNHGFIPVTVGDLSPGPSENLLVSLGLRSPDVAIFVMDSKSGDVERLKSTSLQFGEALEYDPVRGVFIGGGRDRAPGTYDSYLFLKFDKETGSVVATTTTNVGDLDSIARDPFSGIFYAVDNQPGTAVNLWKLDPDTGKGNLVKHWNKSELLGYEGMIGVAFVARDVAYGLLHKGGHIPMDEYRLVRIDISRDYAMCLLPERNLGLGTGLHLSAPTALPGMP